MSDKLTLVKARGMVAEILLSDPEVVFDNDHRQCMYFYADGKPACVVGHVFARIGIKRSDLRYGGLGDANSVMIYGLADETFNDRITRQAVDFLNEVQKDQDRGHTWQSVYDKFYGEEADDEAAS